MSQQKNGGGDLLAQGMRLAWWIGGGTLALIAGGVLLLAAAVIFLMGGVVGQTTYLGTAEIRPATWLSLVTGSDFPTTVTLGDMIQESGGKATAANYNCSNGQAANQPCPLQFFGQGVTTLSVDAGLMQINSGTPYPAAPKWHRVFGNHSPYDPKLNVAEGIRELNDDTAQCGGYLEYGLSAYNSGGCQTAKGLAYAFSVLQHIQSYQGPPQASAWATGNYVGAQQQSCWVFFRCGPMEHYWRQPYPHAPTWILAQGAYELPPPAAYPQRVLWAPPPPGCTGRGCRPVTLQIVPVSNPTMMWLGPHPGNGRPMAMDPPGAPIMPGQTAWAVKVTQPGTYEITAEWKWQTCSGSPPTCVWHRRFATTSVTILPAKTA